MKIIFEIFEILLFFQDFMKSINFHDFLLKITTKINVRASKNEDMQIVLPESEKAPENPSGGGFG